MLLRLAIISLIAIIAHKFAIERSEPCEIVKTRVYYSMPGVGMSDSNIIEECKAH